MSTTTDELADFLYDEAMNNGRGIMTRDDSRRLAVVMVEAAKTHERVLAEVREGW